MLWILHLECDEDDSDDETMKRQRRKRAHIPLFSDLAVKGRTEIMPQRAEAQGHKGVCLEETFCL